MDKLVLKLVVALQSGLLNLRDNLADRERGATAVEYGLMVSLIAAVIITAVALIGTNLTALFNSVAGSV